MKPEHEGFETEQVDDVVKERHPEPAGAVIGSGGRDSDYYYEDVTFPFQTPQYLFVSVGAAFYEDFKGGTAPGWIPDTPGWVVRDGHYRAGATAAGGARTYSSRYNKIFYDFSYRAHVRVYSGGPNVLLRGVGLVFRGGYTYDDGYVFHINANGYYLIFKRYRGRTYLMTPSWTPSPYINRGIGAWNRLEVIAARDYLGNTQRQRFLINGHEVKSLVDRTFIAGRPGLKMYGNPANGEPPPVETYHCSRDPEEGRIANL